MSRFRQWIIGFLVNTSISLARPTEGKSKPPPRPPHDRRGLETVFASMELGNPQASMYAMAEGRGLDAGTCATYALLQGELLEAGRTILQVALDEHVPKDSYVELTMALYTVMMVRAELIGFADRIGPAASAPGTTERKNVDTAAAVSTMRLLMESAPQGLHQCALEHGLPDTAASSIAVLEDRLQKGLAGLLLVVEDPQFPQVLARALHDSFLEISLGRGELWRLLNHLRPLEHEKKK